MVWKISSNSSKRNLSCVTTSANSDNSSAVSSAWLRRISISTLITPQILPLTHTCRLFRFCLWLTHSVSSVSHRLRLFSLSRILPFQFIWLFMPWASQLFWEMMQSRFPFKLVVEKKMDRLQKNIHLLLSSSLFTHSPKISLRPVTTKFSSLSFQI